MKLKSGCIFWRQIYEGAKLRTSALLRDVRCDVAVIGAGISGALTAYLLTRRGIQTVMVDRREVASGSTPASTGLLQYEIDTSLVELTKLLGKERAVAAYRASVEALLAFEPLVEELGGECGLVARPSLYVASKKKDVPKLLAECEARQAMGIDVKFLSGEELKSEFNVDRPGALVSARAFEIDPYRLTMQLVRRAMERGLEVYSPTQISEIISEEDGVMLVSSNGVKIKAKKLIMATGYETMDMLPSGLCKLLSTYALASEPMSFEFWPERFLIWEMARPYLYARTTVDDRAIVGGEDEKIVDPKKRDALLEEKAKILCERFLDLFPGAKIETKCAWAGTFAQSKDGLPYIGTFKGRPDIFFALGYGGNGITFSLLAAWMALDWVLGRETHWTRLFGFER